MAGKCFSCHNVPNAVRLWLFALLNGLMNVLGCLCLSVTCRCKAAIGRLCQVKLADPADGVSNHLALGVKHAEDARAAAMAKGEEMVRGAGTGFVDPAFPTPGSVAGCSVEWKRPGEVVERARVWGEVDSNDVAQGRLGDCYLLASLSALAERPGMIEGLIAGAEGGGGNLNGAYAVVLYKNGKPEPVLIDDRIPVATGGAVKRAADAKGRVAQVFSSTKKADGEIWVSMIEKAWVKAYAGGNWQAVAGGRPSQALRALTGAPTEEVHHDNASIDELWEALREGLAGGGVAAASTSGSSVPVCGNGGLPPFMCALCHKCGRFCFTCCLRKCIRTLQCVTTTMACLWALVAGALYYVVCWPLEKCCGSCLVRCALSRTGLVPGHAYGVIRVAVVPTKASCGGTERIVCVRNPWGHGEWKGAWSDNSWRWGEGAKATAGFTAENDGTFWMSISDYARFFDHTTLCHLRPGWTGQSWDAATRGQQAVVSITVPADADTSYTPPAGTDGPAAGAGDESIAVAPAGSSGACVYARVALEHVLEGVDVHGSLRGQAVRMCVVEADTGAPVGSSRASNEFTSFGSATATCTTQLRLQPGHTYDVCINWQRKDQFMGADDGRNIVLGLYSSSPGLDMTVRGAAPSSPTARAFVPANKRLGECDKCHRALPPEHNYVGLKRLHPGVCEEV